jgi:protein-S-isoprenylcysteine O-methyltransferase Ste14
MSAYPLWLRGQIGALLQPLVVMIFLILPTVVVPGGNWRWPRAWILLGVYALLLVPTVAWLARSAPQSLEARLRLPRCGRQPPEDRRVTRWIGLFFLGWLVFLSVDVQYLRLLPVPAAVFGGLGGFVFVLGYGLITVAIYQNPFSVQFVEDQSDQGQRVIDGGLYRYLRHPLYLGVQLFCMGMAFWLESASAGIASLGMGWLLVSRIAIEERVLHATLPDYGVYCERVPYRLLPLIW